jgi:hypothetical protein
MTEISILWTQQGAINVGTPYHASNKNTMVFVILKEIWKHNRFLNSLFENLEVAVF